MDRYKVLYIKKSLLGIVPELNLKTQTNSRRGLKINVPKYEGTSEKIFSLFD